MKRRSTDSSTSTLSSTGSSILIKTKGTISTVKEEEEGEREEEGEMGEGEGEMEVGKESPFAKDSQTPQ